MSAEEPIAQAARMRRMSASYVSRQNAARARWFGLSPASLEERRKP
jgi:hypothetical protein